MNEWTQWKQRKQPGRDENLKTCQGRESCECLGPVCAVIKLTTFHPRHKKHLNEKVLWGSRKLPLLFLSITSRKSANSRGKPPAVITFINSFQKCTHERTLGNISQNWIVLFLRKTQLMSFRVQQIIPMIAVWNLMLWRLVRSHSTDKYSEKSKCRCHPTPYTSLQNRNWQYIWTNCFSTITSTSRRTSTSTSKDTRYSLTCYFLRSVQAMWLSETFILSICGV